MATIIKVNGQTIKIESKTASVESFDLEKSNAELDAFETATRKAVEALNLIADTKAMESFGYQSTEGVTDKIKTVGKVVWDKIVQFFQMIIKKLGEFKTWITQQFNKLVAKVKGIKFTVIKEAFKKIKKGDESSYKEAAATVIIEESKLVAAGKMQPDPFLAKIVKEVAEKNTQSEEPTQTADNQYSTLASMSTQQVLALPQIDPMTLKIKQIVESNVANEYFAAVAKRSELSGNGMQNLRSTDNSDIVSALSYGVGALNEIDDSKVDEALDRLEGFMHRAEGKSARGDDVDYTAHAELSDWGKNKFISEFLDESSFSSSTKALKSYDDTYKVLTDISNKAIAKCKEMYAKEDADSNKKLELAENIAAVANKYCQAISAEGTARVRLMSMIATF